MAVNPYKTGNLQKGFTNIINDQYHKTRGLSKHDMQSKENVFRNEGYEGVKNPNCDLSHIYGYQSYQNHKSNAKVFAEYLEKHHKHKIERVRDVKKEHCHAFFKYLRHEKGLAVKTISGYQTTINHIFHDCKVDDWRTPVYAKESVGTRQQDVISRNRSKQGNHERVAISSYSEKYQDVFRLGQAFGLRRGEMLVRYDKSAYKTHRDAYRMHDNKSFSNHPARTNSMIEYQDKLYFQTIGKGGRFRTVQCLKEHESEIRAHFSDVITQVDKLASKEEYLEQERTSELLFKSHGNTNDQLSLNFQEDCRQYYANALLDELRSEPQRHNVSHELLPQNRTKTGYEYYTTNHETMLRTEAQYISEMLGHSRIDVLKAYIRV